jgi:hypothetical protein
VTLWWFDTSGFLTSLIVELQTYVGDWGEELLEGRVDVADFFD